MTKPKKTEHEILRERLAELSSNIPTKVGKLARDHAVDTAKSLVKQAKNKLAADFKLWLSKGLFDALPKEVQELYENYVTVGKQVEDHLKKVVQSYKMYDSDKASPVVLSIEQFVSGYRTPYKWNNEIEPALTAWHNKIKGYDKKKAEFDARVKELDEMVSEVERAVFRTYKNRAAVTQQGINISEAVSTAMKSALGTNLLAASKAVEAELVTDVA